ncbi:hypothetical protein [Streptomyces sp. NPDC085540]|uniref:hypothetical protein n=1 Tax=Streptomyces sp. NPDC085540 TaxID=3365730 RepID=UPI0037CF50EE
MESPDGVPVVLRRKVARILPWVIFPGFAIFGALAVMKVASVSGYGEAWKGIPVILFICSYIGRLLAPRVLLGAETLTIVNPIWTHVCDRSDMRWVAIGEGGGLEIHFRDGGVIAVAAFSGSLIDRMVGTSVNAAREISSWMADPGECGIGRAPARVKVWTRSPTSDIAFGLAVASTVAGLVNLSAF